MGLNPKGVCPTTPPFGWGVRPHHPTLRVGGGRLNKFNWPRFPKETGAKPRSGLPSLSKRAKTSPLKEGMPHFLRKRGLASKSYPSKGDALPLQGKIPQVPCQRAGETTRLLAGRSPAPKRAGDRPTLRVGRSPGVVFFLQTNLPQRGMHWGFAPKLSSTPLQNLTC